MSISNSPNLLFVSELFCNSWPIILRPKYPVLISIPDLLNAKTDIPMVGASGAVFGILLAFAILFPNMQLMLLIPPIPIKAKYLVLVYGIYELWSEFNRMPGDNVAHLAHLGGMLIAYIILRYWKNKYGTYY